MEKRTLIAVVLSAVVFVLYYGFIYKPPVPAPKAPLAQGPTATPAALAPSTATPTAAVPQASPNAATSAAPQTPKQMTTVATPMIKADFSSLSGLPERWWLKKYFINANNQGPNIDLLVGPNGIPSLGLLLLPGSPPVFPGFLVQEEQEKKVVYRGKVGDLEVTEVLTLADHDYALDMVLTVENRGSAPAELAPGVHLENLQNTAAPKGFWIFRETPNLLNPVYRIGPKVSRHDNVEKLGTHTEEVGDISWAGIQDRYFLRAVLPREVSPQNKVAYGNKGASVFVDFRLGSTVLPAGQKKDFAFTLYLGPKNPSDLKGFGSAELDKVIDWGWFGWAAVPILQLLKWFQSVLHNWGLAIIALTLLIKLATNPLTKKSMQSMKAMQKLQPQLQAIREKYANDRERLNVETMSLFRQNKVNPMGGCLPMALQMPIYIALYKVLYNATDLYHAPFFGPYRDLSASDPYFIMPVILGILMVAQQKMTPSAGDPAQAKMMMLMPVMFSVFMLFLPVGLVLYILVNTLMTVVQQYMSQKDLTVMGLIKGARGTS